MLAEDPKHDKALLDIYMRILLKLKLQKKDLMDDLLTGKIRVNVDKPVENQRS
jgi:hypothetical protein